MMTRRIVLAIGATMLLAGLTFAIVAGAQADVLNPFGYGTRSLEGATPEQVGRFGIEYARRHLYVRSGSPEALLVRPIKSGDLPALGLGCSLTFAAKEEPPLMLVVLEGDFDFRNMPTGLGSVAYQLMPRKYVAYVFDVWSARPAFMTSSPNGGRFRTVLGDNTLPADGPVQPLNCPSAPEVEKTLHYGETPAGFTPADGK